MTHLLALGATVVGIAFYLVLVYSLPFFLFHANANANANANAYATILEMESPPLLNETGLTLSDDTLDTDVTVSVDDLEEDALSENKTQMISSEGADDLDIDGFPPKDVSVIITNESVMVTRNPVIVEMYDVVPDIRDEIADVARQQSSGSVIIDLPDDYPNTETTVVASTEDEDEDQDDEDDGDEE